MSATKCLIRSEKPWVSPYEWTSASEKNETISHATVTIRMLSGDLITIDIDPRKRMASFPHEFALHAGYNPNLTRRYRFLIEDKKNDEEDGEMVDLIANVEHQWSDRFSDVEQIPLIHFLVLPSDETLDTKKVELLRQIAEGQKLSCPMTDDEIMAHYEEWFLTYQPPAKSNRYIHLSEFVKRHPHFFPSISQDVIDELLAHYQSAKNECEAIDKKMKYIQNQKQIYNLVLGLRDQNIREIYRRRDQYSTPEEFEQTHTATLFEFSQQTCQDPTGSFMKEKSTFVHFFKHLTPFEMAGLGYPMAILYNMTIARTFEHFMEEYEKNYDSILRLWEIHTTYKEEFGEESGPALQRKLEYYQREEVALRLQSIQIYDNCRVLGNKLRRIKLI